MSGDRHITWENFERDVVRANLPAIHPIPGSPRVALFFKPEDSELGLLIALPGAKPVASSPFREIQIGALSSPDGPQLHISTQNRRLYRQLFPVLLEIADAVQLDGVDPHDAADSAVTKVAEAIRLLEMPTDERVLGLWGELWALKRLLCTQGSNAIYQWYGWQADRHDFRIGNTELEVKTTVAIPVTHVIHGIGQLEASDGHSLYLLSVAVSRSRDGRSALSLLEDIERLLVNAGAERKYLADALAGLRISRDVLMSKTECYTLRRPVLLVPIDEKVPAIGSKVLSNWMQSDALGRLTDLNYKVNVEGLGCGPETSLFQNAVPWMVAHD